MEKLGQKPVPDQHQLCPSLLSLRTWPTSNCR